MENVRWLPAKVWRWVGQWPGSKAWSRWLRWFWPPIPLRGRHSFAPAIRHPASKNRRPRPGTAGSPQTKTRVSVAYVISGSHSRLKTGAAGGDTTVCHGLPPITALYFGTLNHHIAILLLFQVIFVTLAAAP